MEVAEYLCLVGWELSWSAIPVAVGTKGSEVAQEAEPSQNAGGCRPIWLATVFKLADSAMTRLSLSLAN